MNCFIDIETTVPIPDDWNTNPTNLPIACIGVKIDNVNTVVYSNTENTKKEMTDAQVMDVVDKLLGYHKLNCKLVSFNGSGFDLRLLSQYAQKYGKYKEVREMNLAHIDIMFIVQCERGHPVSLSKLCESMKIGEKSLKGGGIESLKLWEDGRIQEVFDYNKKDVELLKDLYDKIQSTNEMSFISRAGNRFVFKVKLMDVQSANKLIPVPERALVNRNVFIW